MANAIYNLYAAKTALSQLVDRAAAGEEIVIAKAGRPLARLVPIEARSVPRRPGAWKGQVWIAEDFDAPLPPEIAAAFGVDEGMATNDRLLLDTHVFLIHAGSPLSSAASVSAPARSSRARGIRPSTT